MGKLFETWINTPTRGELRRAQMAALTETDRVEGTDPCRGLRRELASANAEIAKLTQHRDALEDALSARTTELYPDLQAEIAKLREKLSAASGYLLNAKIDLETGAPKRTAIKTIEGGLKVVRDALTAGQGT